MDNQPFATPLLSWDIYHQGYRRRIALAKDLQTLEEISKASDWKKQWDLKELLLGKERVVLLTKPDQTISFASSNLLTMNGYLPQEVVGKSPRIFQGAKTNPVGKAIVRDAVAAQKPFALSILNYRKNGLPYMCNVEGYPVFNKKGNLVHFIAFEHLDETGY